MSPIADPQSTCKLDTIFLKLLEFMKECGKMHHAAISNYAMNFGAQDTRRKKVKSILYVINNDAVPCVGAAIESGTDIECLRDDVHDFPFSLVAPLSSKNGGHLRELGSMYGCCHQTT